MAATIGKRKRRIDRNPDPPGRLSKSEGLSGDESTARALFQKAFEAKFQPLQLSVTTATQASKTELEEDRLEHDSGSEWDGLSNSEHEIEVVEHVASEYTIADGVSTSKKSFMVSGNPDTDVHGLLKLTELAVFETPHLSR